MGQNENFLIIFNICENDQHQNAVMTLAQEKLFLAIIKIKFALVWKKYSSGSFTTSLLQNLPPNRRDRSIECEKWLKNELLVRLRFPSILLQDRPRWDENSFCSVTIYDKKARLVIHTWPGHVFFSVLAESKFLPNGFISQFQNAAESTILT